MDERESIPRHEAIAGLGLLAALTAGLVGTIVFRIVNAAPQQANSKSAIAWSTDTAAAIAADSTISAPAADSPQTAGLEATDDVHTGKLPQATPIPATDSSASMPAAAVSEAPPWNPSTTPSPPTERPRFVAPANH
jgi:hypothetical protein